MTEQRRFELLDRAEFDSEDDFIRASFLRFWSVVIWPESERTREYFIAKSTYSEEREHIGQLLVDDRNWRRLVAEGRLAVDADIGDGRQP